MRILVRLLAFAALIAPQVALALDPGKVPPIVLGTGSSGDVSAMSVTPLASAPSGTLARSLSDQASSLAAKAPLASPVFTGSPSMPTLTLTGTGSTGDVSEMSRKASGGSTLRSLSDAAADRPVGLDFGVSKGGADQSEQIAKALGLVPSMALSKGSYALTTPLALPAATNLTMLPGSSFAFSGAGSLSLGAGARYEDQGYGVTKDQDAVVRSFGAMRATSGQDAFGLNQYAYPAFLRATSSDAAAIGAGFATNFLALHNFGGSSVTGGRIANYGVLNQTAIASASNLNRNYVGTSGVARTATGDGGTNTNSGAKGAYFGLHGYCQNFGGQSLLECAGAEFNTYMQYGSSAQIVAGVSSIGMNYAQGTLVDAAYLVGFGTEFSTEAANVGHPPLGWRYGLQFSDSNGVDPISSNGVLIGSNWKESPTTPRQILTGLDLRGFAPSQAGLIGKANAIGVNGNFLEWMNAAGNADLFTVNAAGQMQTVGIQGRTGTTGVFGPNYYNFNWNGSGLDAYVDSVGVGTVETRVAAPTSSTSACSVGVRAYDSNYEYRCVAANRWRRIAFTSDWP
ncbi:hypothetical protein [Methylobacterium komagatae]